MRTIATLIAAAVGFYLLLSVLLFFMQERMLFLARMPGRQLETTPRDVGFEYVDVNFETADGVSLHGWYVHADKPRGTVLFLHGNAGNISHRLDSIAIFHELGLDTFIIDYRGYGQSEGKTSEEGTYRDAEAAWEYLVTERGLDPARIVVFGRSLGGAVAAELATHHTPAALIVESSFPSVAEMASHLYPFIPVRHMLRLRYPVIDYVTRITSPILIVHSRDDDIIPFAMGQALYEAAPEPKAFLELAGDHNNGFLLSRNRYRQEVGEFIRAQLQKGIEQN